MLSTIVRSSHPIPTFAVTILTLLLAIAFRVPSVNAVMIVVAVFFNQIAIGLSNDIIDVARDKRAGRTDKPLATGALSLRSAWIVVGVSSVISLGLSVLVDPLVGIWQAVLGFRIRLQRPTQGNGAVRSSVRDGLCGPSGARQLGYPAPELARMVGATRRCEFGGFGALRQCSTRQ